MKDSTINNIPDVIDFAYTIENDFNNSYFIRNGLASILLKVVNNIVIKAIINTKKIIANHN